jgi:hypothetical protein
MKRDTAEAVVTILGVAIAFVLVCGIGFAVAMGIAWAITSIWPSVPFWPAAVGIFLLSALFSRSSSK